MTGTGSAERAGHDKRCAMPLPSPLREAALRLAAAWRRRAVMLKATSFAVVGVVNTAIDTAVFFAALAYVTSSLVAANVLAWGVAVSGSYVLNSFTTFGPESGRQLRVRDYLAFLGSGVAAVTASTIALVIAAGYVPVWAAKAVAILVSFAVNFTITNLIVFRPRRHGETRADG
jgi:putative flippase GtrA